MATEKPESDPILARIEAKVAAWQAVAEMYRTAIALEGGQLGDIDVSALASPASGLRTSNTGPVDLPTGAFRNTGMAPAVKIYLAAAKRKQTLKQIAAALKEGGLESTASDFERSLNTTLYRLKNDGVLLQFKEGWDLAEAYPEHFRQRLTKDSKPTTKPTTMKKRKRIKSNGNAKLKAKGNAKKAAPAKTVTKSKRKAATDAPSVAPAA